MKKTALAGKNQRKYTSSMSLRKIRREIMANSTPVNTSYKWCANCVWWAGPRTFNAFFGRAEIFDSHAKGKCMNRKGYFNLETNWLTTCPGFEFHSVIKH